MIKNVWESCNDRKKGKFDEIKYYDIYYKEIIANIKKIYIPYII